MTFLSLLSLPKSRKRIKKCGWLNENSVADVCLDDWWEAQTYISSHLQLISCCCVSDEHLWWCTDVWARYKFLRYTSVSFSWAIIPNKSLLKYYYSTPCPIQKPMRRWMFQNDFSWFCNNMDEWISGGGNEQCRFNKWNPISTITSLLSWFHYGPMLQPTE